jgi:hypothetical protein
LSCLLASTSDNSLATFHTMIGASILATLVLAVAGVHGHATFQYMGINGVDQGTTCVRPPASNSPITSPTSNVSLFDPKSHYTH